MEREPPLCLGRAGGRAVGGGAGAELAGPRAGLVGEGVSRARRRLVARSRHYAGRHFLSDPGEEREREGGGRCSARPPASPRREGRGEPWAGGTTRSSARPSPLQRAAFGDVGSTLLGRPCCRPHLHPFAVVAAELAERRVPERPLATLAAGVRGGGWSGGGVSGIWPRLCCGGRSLGTATRGPDRLCRFDCSL